MLNMSHQEKKERYNPLLHKTMHNKMHKSTIFIRFFLHMKKQQPALIYVDNWYIKHLGGNLAMTCATSMLSDHSNCIICHGV